MENLLIVSDLDGTLLNDKHELSLRTKEEVKRLQDDKIPFTIATARSLGTAERFIKELDLQHPVILYNGSQVYCPVQQKNLFLIHLEQSLYQEVLSFVQQKNFMPIVHCTHPDGSINVYFSSLKNSGEQFFLNSMLKLGDKRFRVTPDYSETKELSVIEVLAIGAKDDIVETATELRKNENLSVLIFDDLESKGFCWLEVSHKDSNKGNGVTFVKEHLKLEKSLCFGDNYNDLEMFDVADYSVVMGNALDAIKEKADLETESHGQDGVAVFLQKVREGKITL